MSRVSQVPSLWYHGAVTCSRSRTIVVSMSERIIPLNAVGTREARVDHRDAHLGFPADQDLMDPVPDPVQGIAPEHVVSGLVFSVPRRHVLPTASVSQNMQYAVQRFLQVDTLHSPLLGQERLDQFDVLVVGFADAHHGGFSLASAGTLASRARFAQEAPPALRPWNQTRQGLSRKFWGPPGGHSVFSIGRLARSSRSSETAENADAVGDFRLKSKGCATQAHEGEICIL